jgi:sulfide:quinone oxidoreductase
MEIRNIAPGVAVAAQIAPTDLAGLQAAGYAAIICNRPDGEDPGQPSFASIEREARRHGMAARYLPVVPGNVTAEHGAAFAALLAELPGPVLAYCRTGKRSETLFALAHASRAGDSRAVDARRA